MMSNNFPKKIAIHSVPRSGSSWLGQIFNSSPNVNFKFQPLFSYAFKDFLCENSSKKQIEEFFQIISESNDDFLLQTEKVNEGTYPKFQKNSNYTHIVYKEVRYHHILENMMRVEPNIIVIGIIRNPCAVISSFLKAPKEFRKDLNWNELKEWQYANNKNLDKKEEFNGFEKWKEAAILFYRLKTQYPDRFYLINYSKLLKNTKQEIERVFKFCGIDIDKKTQDFILNSKIINKNNAYSVFKTKTKDDAWKNDLNPLIIKAITDNLENSHLKKYLNG